ncbi:MAG: alkylation response protein AidB-like acyl-CoA dehydrogenase [Candidatus Poriferisodalaceae bacterium]|jgi:alkylation response protein AidB-like acyl-CoA dehydrogenase
MAVTNRAPIPSANWPDLSPEAEVFRPVASQFLQESLTSGIACPAFGAILVPALHDQAVAWQRHCNEHGFAGLHWPTDFGGRGLSVAHTAVWNEECARAEVAPYLNLQGLVLAGESIIRAGTEAQKAQLLPATLAADILWCQLFSEPGAGSDLAGLQTKAERDGDHFVVSGQKVWSSNAQFAQYGILMARTDPEQPTHKGLSFFLFNMSLPGVEVRPLKQMTGDSEFCEVFLDEVAMPADALLGELHGGWAVAMNVLEDERGSVGSGGVISLERRVTSLLSGSNGGSDLERQELASLMSNGIALRSLVQLRGSDPLVAPLTKLIQSELGVDEVRIETAFRGPHAMLLDEVTERFLYAPGMRIAGGSSEIQRNIIGERLLGLPREPRG